jgi:SMI1-KNR4 cell-wall
MERQETLAPYHGGYAVTDPFEDDDYYTGPPLTPELITAAERTLGYRLPRSYLDVLSIRNGAVLRHGCFLTDFVTAWAADLFEVRGLLGLGGEWGIDATSGQGSVDMIEEWGYPEIWIVICDMPSGGAEAVMLDYSAVGPEGEPAVSYIDEDRNVHRVADSFEQFLSGLVERPPTSTRET